MSYMCVKWFLLFTTVQKLYKSIMIFQSYDHKCSATFLWFTVYITTVNFLCDETRLVDVTSVDRENVSRSTDVTSILPILGATDRQTDHGQKDTVHNFNALPMEVGA